MAAHSLADFEMATKDIRHWLLLAETLRHAAIRLWDEADAQLLAMTQGGTHGVGDLPLDGVLHPGLIVMFAAPARMLYGLAVENLIKACIIKKSHFALPKIGVNGKIAWEVAHHDLLGYLAKAQLAPRSETERLLLQDFTAWIRWQGKYPVPVDVNRLPDKRMFFQRRAADECYLWVLGELKG